MASQGYGMLDQADEDAYHRSRLLNIEMRPFQRIARRLLSSESLVYAPPNSYPSPPPDGDAIEEEAASREARRVKQAAERQQWREEMLLDIANLEETMARIQLLRRSNEAERERYAAEKVRIIDTAKLIRQNTVELRSQLEEAQKTLAMRKNFDKLTEKITSNKLLKPREDQQASIERLEAEIAELERESGAYAQTWAERREQFGKIVEEGKQMLRLIRDEKEEAERKEGMEEVDDADTSRAGTPPLGSTEGLTPLPATDAEGGATPQRPMLNDLLAPGLSGRQNRSRTSSPHRSSSNVAPEGRADDITSLPEPSPAGSRTDFPPEEGDDIDMVESGEVEDPPSEDIAEDETTADRVANAEAEDGQMDTT